MPRAVNVHQRTRGSSVNRPARLRLKQLTLKFGALPEGVADPEGVAERVRRSSSEQLDRWAERILVAEDLDALFAD